MPIINTREELANRLNTIFGERNDDDTLSFIQDTLETFDHHSANNGGISQEEHDRLMQEQDNAWRNRYKQAFLSGNPDAALGDNHKPQRTSREDPADEVAGHTEDNPASFDDLFGN